MGQAPVFGNVLVGVDFRRSGRDAIALASQLMDREGTMTLAHVHSERVGPAHLLDPRLLEQERERAEATLEQERATAEVQAQLLLAHGPTPGQALHEAAEQRGADLLVLGSCHRGVLGRAMLGDDTRAAIDGAPCAVAIAPAGLARRPRPIATIGVAYDGSHESEVALQVARTLAASRDARIRALHVVSLAAYQYAAIGAMVLTDIDDSVSRADAVMKAIEGVDGRAEFGLPAEDLAAFSAEVDLLIVGSRGYGPWGRLVHGSTSAQLARHTRGPLLIVPRPDRPARLDGEPAQAAVAAKGAETCSTT